jgi:hypothetical protein
MVLYFPSLAASSRLRLLISASEQEVAALSAHAEAEDDRSSVDHLRQALAEIGALLALGPEPEIIDCPDCGHAVRRTATRCGYCWHELKPSRSLSADVRQSEVVWETDGGRLPGAGGQWPRATQRPNDR